MWGFMKESPPQFTRNFIWTFRPVKKLRMCDTRVRMAPSNFISDYNCRCHKLKRSNWYGVFCMFQAAPYVTKRTVGNQTFWEGFCFDLIDEMASKLNFK